MICLNCVWLVVLPLGSLCFSFLFREFGRKWILKRLDRLVRFFRLSSIRLPHLCCWFLALIILPCLLVSLLLSFSRFLPRIFCFFAILRRPVSLFCFCLAFTLLPTFSAMGLTSSWEFVLFFASQSNLNLPLFLFVWFVYAFLFSSFLAAVVVLACWLSLSNPAPSCFLCFRLFSVLGANVSSWPWSRARFSTTSSWSFFRISTQIMMDN